MADSHLVFHGVWRIPYVMGAQLRHAHRGGVRLGNDDIGPGSAVAAVLLDLVDYM